MLAGPGSAEQLSSPMSAVHSPEHLASVPVTFGEDGDLAAFACHEQQELAASVHQRPGGDSVEEFPLRLHVSFSSFFLKLLFNSAKG